MSAGRRDLPDRFTTDPAGAQGTRASGGGGREDLRLLAAELGLERADEVLAVAEETFGDRLDPAARFFVEEMFNS